MRWRVTTGRQQDEQNIMRGQMATSQPAQGKSAAFSQADQWRATASPVTVENNFFLPAG